MGHVMVEYFLPVIIRADPWVWGIK
jgi:hypothetical protein